MSIVRTEDCSQECFKVDWNQHKKYCKQIAKLGGWRDSEDCAEGVGVIILAEELRIQKLTQKSAEHMVLGFALPGDNTILSKTEADSALMQLDWLLGSGRHISGIKSAFFENLQKKGRDGMTRGLALIHFLEPSIRKEPRYKEILTGLKKIHIGT
jgi:hypothetical protein